MKLYPSHLGHVKDNTVNVSVFHRSGIRNGNDQGK